MTTTQATAAKLAPAPVWRQWTNSRGEVFRYAAGIGWQYRCLGAEGWGTVRVPTLLSNADICRLAAFLATHFQAEYAQAIEAARATSTR